MATPARAPVLSPEFRAGLYQFSVFGSTGAASVYFAIWLTERGIGADAIGVINAVPVLLMFAANVLIGRLADRASDWRTMVIILSLLAGVIPAWLFFVNDFWGILLVWTACSLPAGALVPVVDAATLRMTQRRGSDFGAVRAWATVGYMVATAVTGLVISWYGSAAFLPLFLGWSLLRAALGFLLPRFRAPDEERKPKRAERAGRLRDTLKPWFVLPLVAFAFIQTTHIIHSAFAALVWREQGIGADIIGWLIAVSALAEAAIMFFWRRIGGRMSARLMILIAAGVGVARWVAMALAPPVWVLVGLQALHAITIPFSYFGVLLFVANWTEDDIAAEAQSFASALAQGAGVVGLLGFGWIASMAGGTAYLAAAAFCAAAGVCVVISLRLKPAHA